MFGYSWIGGVAGEYPIRSRVDNQQANSEPSHAEAVGEENLQKSIKLKKSDVDIKLMSDIGRSRGFYALIGGTQTMRLVAEYYKEKYNCDITVLDTTSSASLKKAIEKSQRERKTRCAYIIGAGAKHAVPIIYMNENGQQAILIADSLGIAGISATGGITKEIALALTNGNLNINVYVVKSGSQADLISCYTGALVFARDATAMTNEKKYRIPNLLSSLQENKTDTNSIDEYHETTLPPGLLKHTQLSSFLNEHMNDEEKMKEIVHENKIRGNETIGEFIARHKNNMGAHEYLRMKGLKLRDIIEIQFYLNAMSEEIGINKLPPFLAKQFSAEAKEVILSQPDVLLTKAEVYEFSSYFFAKLPVRMKIHNSKLIRETLKIPEENRSKDQRFMIDLYACYKTTTDDKISAAISRLIILLEDPQHTHSSSFAEKDVEALITNNETYDVLRKHMARLPYNLQDPINRGTYNLCRVR